MTLSPHEVQGLVSYLTEAEQAELAEIVSADLAAVRWRPLPGPQTMAFYSEADVVGYGGAAGGGKTDLALGLGLTVHSKTQFFRLEATQLVGAVDRMIEILGSRQGYNGADKILRLPGEGRQIEMCSMPNPGDEQKYQGRGKDLLVVDEATNIPEARVRFVKGWVRSAKDNQRCRTLFTFNPPTNAEGRWIVAFFGPWLDKRHPLYPTTPGDLRYVYTDPNIGKDVWLREADPRPFVLDGGRRRYVFDPADYRAQDIITPESRTFIPSRITDNPYLVNTGYMRELQALPEPLRSQMLFGDFEAGVKDDAFQVCPTAWVEAAQRRWRERAPRGEMLSMGTDVARGGDDRTIIATRHMAGDCPWWIDRLSVYPGTETPNGNIVAGLVIGARRDLSPIHIDIVGVGSSPYDILKDAGQDVYGINSGERATGSDKSGRLTFVNRKSQLWWRLRELLDPANDTGIALPPDGELLAELTAPRWMLSGMQVKVENREDIIKRVGRSVDKASAVLLALIETPKLSTLDDGGGLEGYDPYAGM